MNAFYPIAVGLAGFAEIWVWIGAAVALVFLCWGIDRIEPNARGSYVFRSLIAPGVMLLWPLVVGRWLWLESGREDWRLRHAPPRIMQGRMAVATACVVIALLVIGFGVKQTAPERGPAVQVEAAQ